MTNAGLPQPELPSAEPKPVEVPAPKTPVITSWASATEVEDAEPPDFVPPASPWKKFWRITLISAGVLFVLGLVFGKSGYGVFKDWRAAGLSQSALTALKAGDFQEAMNNARSAMLLSPKLIESQRAMASLLSAARDGNALSAWKQVLDSPKANLEDRRAAVDCALGLNQAATAAEWVQPLLAAAPNDPKNLLLAAKSAALNNQRPEALALAQQAVEADANSLGAALFFQTLRLLDPATRDEAVEALFNLTAHDESEGLAAAETLAKVPLTAEQKERLIARLRSHPKAQEPHRLLALTMEIQLHPEQRGDLLAAVSKSYQSGDSKAFRDYLAWLNSNGETKRVEELLPLETAKTRKDLFLVWLDTQAALKQWERIRDVLSDRPVPLEDVYAELYLTRCADELKQDTESDLHWRLAQAATQGAPEQMLYLANYAEKQGRTQRAQIAYEGLANNPLLARQAYEGLLRLAQKGKTEQVAEVLTAMNERWPKDTAVQNDLAYFNLLLRRDVPKMRELAETLTKSEPASLPHRTALALGYLRERNLDAAAQVYAGLQVDWKSAPASSIAIYAAVLQAQGRDEMATSLSRSVNPDTLRPEEQLLLYGVY